MSPRELLHSHKYEKAIAAYRDQLEKKPNDPGTLGGTAKALMCLKDFEKASIAFESARMADRSVLRGSPLYLAEIAAARWLAGRRAEAKICFRRMVDGILDGSIKFADLAGGVLQGLQLWYASVTMEDNEQADYALNYLKRLANQTTIKNFPGPIACYILKRSSFAELLTSVTGGEDLRAGIEAAKVDVLMRRHLCGVLFYDGVLARANGSEGQCLTRMRQCSSLENPINEIEWYLARGESEV